MSTGRLQLHLKPGLYGETVEIKVNGNTGDGDSSSINSQEITFTGTGDWLMQRPAIYLLPAFSKPAAAAVCDANEPQASSASSSKTFNNHSTQNNSAVENTDMNNDMEVFI